ncbi:hypothetical protein Q3G72_007388 [Acer saccharum]|nr:hypothetical protein Q3G72_007388 [Acer saccharum]
MGDLIDSSGSGERAFSRNGDDDENGCTSKDQSAFLEESFKEHNTLNPEKLKKKKEGGGDMHERDKVNVYNLILLVMLSTTTDGLRTQYLLSL